jgi:hypothetical protein
MLLSIYLGRTGGSIRVRFSEYETALGSLVPARSDDRDRMGSGRRYVPAAPEIDEEDVRIGYRYDEALGKSFALLYPDKPTSGKQGTQVFDDGSGFKLGTGIRFDHTFYYRTAFVRETKKGWA